VLQFELIEILVIILIVEQHHVLLEILVIIKVLRVRIIVIHNEILELILQELLLLVPHVIQVIIKVLQVRIIEILPDLLDLIRQEVQVLELSEIQDIINHILAKLAALINVPQANIQILELHHELLDQLVSMHLIIILLLELFVPQDTINHILAKIVVHMLDLLDSIQILVLLLESIVLLDSIVLPPELLYDLDELWDIINLMPDRVVAIVIVLQVHFHLHVLRVELADLLALMLLLDLLYEQIVQLVIIIKFQMQVVMHDPILTINQILEKQIE